MRASGSRVVQIKGEPAGGRSTSAFNFPNTYVTPDGDKVFIDSWGTNEVPVVDAATREIVDAIQLPGKVLGSINRAARGCMRRCYRWASTRRDTAAPSS
jgi:hypothetical protein